MKKIAADINYRMFKRAMLDWPLIIQQDFAEYLKEEGRAKINYNEEQIDSAVAVFRETLIEAEQVRAFGRGTKEITEKIMRVVEDDINLSDSTRTSTVNKLIAP